MARIVKKVTKKEEVKAVAGTETAEVKEEVKKTAVRKTTARKAAVKEETAVKKTAVKKETLKASVTLQFAEKTYTEEALVNIAKDVWKFDLNQEETGLKSVDLYVKPEEGRCYYVFNGDVNGSFVI